MEVDITHSNTGTILAEWFGLQAACWGHSNKNIPKNGTSTSTTSKAGPIQKKKKKTRKKIVPSMNKQETQRQINNDMMTSPNQQLRIRNTESRKINAMNDEASRGGKLDFQNIMQS